MSSSVTTSLSPELHAQISDLIGDDGVVLFMKGDRHAPQCGFSAGVVELLDRSGAAYRTVDVLASPELREGIKEYSDWPTIPQLYIDGEFIGGADIVREMDQSGELAKALQAHLPVTRDPRAPTSPPQVVLTEAALEAIRAARTESDEPFLRMEITAHFEHALFFGAQQPGDVEVEAEGVTFLFDQASAARADGIHIDFVSEGERTGFKIDNPNKGRPPAAAAGVAPSELPTKPPELTVTEAARAQFRAALAAEQEDAPGEYGVRVSARRMGATKVDYELGIIAVEERSAQDLELVVDEMRFWLDGRSARNLEGATIDFLHSEAGSSGFKFTNPRIDAGWTNPLAQRLQRLLDEEINPSIAAHGGVVELLELEGDTAYVHMGGGCQGCGMAAVTLNQGIRQRMRELMPEIEHLVDVTDHQAGKNPYYQSGR